MTETDPCEVCKSQQAETHPSNFDGLHQTCPRCGQFKISGTALSMLSASGGSLKRAQLSGWVREQNRSGVVPFVTTDVLKNVVDRKQLPVADRARFLLEEAERGLHNLGDRFNITEPRFLAATYSDSQNDVDFLMQVLKSEGLADFHAMGGECEILPSGYMSLDESRRDPGSSSKAFVAMWFSPELDEAYHQGFEAGILNAGYDAVRVDRIEHVNRIDDEIIRQINTSRFVVADFTGHRGGVYFEAGYALGLGIPVFWTCRESDMEELHFDIRQYNCIAWNTAKDLAERLTTRIEAVIGKGPRP